MQYFVEWLVHWLYLWKYGIPNKVSCDDDNHSSMTVLKNKRWLRMQCRPKTRYPLILHGKGNYHTNIFFFLSIGNFHAVLYRILHFLELVLSRLYCFWKQVSWKLKGGITSRPSIFVSSCDYSKRFLLIGVYISCVYQVCIDTYIPNNWFCIPWYNFMSLSVLLQRGSYPKCFWSGSRITSFLLDRKYHWSIHANHVDHGVRRESGGRSTP